MEKSGVSRRSVVRTGAHAAWTVPVIQLATAAPAHAAVSGGGDLGVAGVVGYEFADDASSVRPDIVLASLTVSNSGPATVNGFSVDIAIPSGVFDSQPSIPATPVFTTTSVISDGSGGWVGHVETSSSIPAANALACGFEIQSVDGVDEQPYRAWAGHNFAYTLTATSSGFTPGVLEDEVQESPLTNLAIPDLLTGTAGHRTADQVAINFTILNDGRKTTNVQSVVLSWYSNQLQDDRWSSPPAAQASAAGWDGGELTGDGIAEPWTYTFFRAGLVLACDDSGASYSSYTTPFSATITLGPGTDESTGGMYLGLKVTGDFANDAYATVPVDVVIGGT